MPEPPDTMNQPTIVVYSRTSSDRAPQRLLFGAIRDAVRYRHLAFYLFIRDIKSQYRQNFLGYFWLIVPIISTTLIWVFLSSSRLISVSTTDLPYPVYVLTGALTWTAFASALTQPLQSFQAGQGIFMKLKVPPEAFLLAGSLKTLFELTLRTLVVVAAISIMGSPPKSAYCLLAIPAILSLVITGFGIGVVLVPINALYHDMQRILTTTLNFGIYLSPVVFAAPKDGIMRVIYDLNPLTPAIIGVRDLLTSGSTDLLINIAMIACIGSIPLVLGLIILRLTLPNLVERMGM